MGRKTTRSAPSCQPYRLTAESLRYLPQGPNQLDKFKEQELDCYEKLVRGLPSGRNTKTDEAMKEVDRVFA